MTKTHRQGTLLRIAGLLSLVLLPPPAQAGIVLLSDTVIDGGQVVELGVDLDRDNIIKFDQLDRDGNLLPGKDRTSPQRPFRFWINNDYDAVLYKDRPPRTDRTTCGDLKFENALIGPPRQVCEQDDYRKGGSNITGTANLNRIESIRDLEDFVSLALRIAPWSGKVEGIKFKVRAIGVRVNLFKGKWKQGSEYLTDLEVANKQVKADHLIALDANWWEVPRALIEVQPAPTGANTGPTGLVRLLLEGLSGTIGCGDNPQDCYLEVRMEDASGTALLSSKLYLQLYDIKDFYDHYSVGTGNGDTPLAVANHENTASRSLLPDKRAPAADGAYILFVHGWRMQNAERIKFAETALKRLYWSGYQGRFGLFSWPTEWFPKPTWQGTARQAIRAAGNPQNYNNSEAIARRSAAGLAQLLDTGGALGGNDVFVFAHSMGNVVVSEALHQPTGKSLLVQTYIATQAAETAAAYDPAVEERNESNSSWPYEENSLFKVTDWFSANPGSCRYRYYEFTALDPDQSKNLLTDAIRTYGVNSGDASTPTGDAAYVRCEVPDKYRYFTGTQHLRDEGATTPAPPAHYYAGIGARAGRILNFYNTVDFALKGWEFNAMTKPDSGLAFWGFNAATEWLYEGDVLLDAATPANRWQMADHYLFDVSLLAGNTEFGWDATEPNPGQYEAIAHIIPPRTRALGAIAAAGGEVNGGEVNVGPVEQGGLGFTGSAYDHSAEFLSDYPSRSSYWKTLRGRFFP